MPYRYAAAMLALLAALAFPHPGASRTPPSFRRATPPYTFRFPLDHASHPAYQTEWWYYTGHLSGGGRTFGYELTFFRVGLDPSRRTGGSRWRLHTLYFAHLAVTDEQGGKFYYTERIGRPALGMAGAREDRYRVWIDKWSAELLNDDTTHRLIAASPDFAIGLTLAPAKPPVVHGRNGVSRKGEGEGHASHYYSMTHMNTSGRLSLHGQAFEVTGLSWMDHEFGTNQLTPRQEGWDWFSIQLDDDRELMLYRLRRKDGTIEPASSGTMVYADGTGKHLAHSAYTIERSGSWKSPESGATYPSGWIIRVPSEDVTLRLTPTVEDQELAPGGLIGVVYWEGSVAVEGRDRGKPVHGVGYVELTGYAGRPPGL